MTTIREKLREAIRRHPFRPFRITLTGGSFHYVAGPEYIAIAAGAHDPAVTLYTPDGMHAIDARHITAVDSL